MRRSFSVAMAAGWTFDSPLRFKPRPETPRRRACVSNAYSRPVERMRLPSASVLPPAPAQKSATISPRFGAPAGRSVGCPRPAPRCAPLWYSGQRVKPGLSNSRTASGL